MSDKTSIAWADSTWNPWIGCTKVSPGCANCYAADYGRRFGVEWGPGKKRRRTSATYWKKPLAWNKQFVCDCGGTRTAAIPFTKGPQDQCPKCAGFNWRKRRIFPSLCDPFDPEVPDNWLADLLALIHRTPNLTWLLLTKRPEHIWSRLQSVGFIPKYCCTESVTEAVQVARCWYGGVPPENIWLGVSAEDQERWDERVPVLLSIPAAKRFVSVEPMLGRINMRDTKHPSYPVQGLSCFCRPGGIDLIIFGGESGPKARPCNVDWIRDGLRQCREAGIAPFIKQLGANPVNSVGQCGVVPLGTLPGHRPWDDPSEWPADLRVREVME